MRLLKFEVCLAMNFRFRGQWANVEYAQEYLSVCLLLPTFLAPKRRFKQDPHGATSQKTAFFIVTAVKTSNLI
jgi:hypothetical protein